MKAAVVRRPGGAEALELEDLPVPEPQAGLVLIRVRAFGLNRSELFTRQGFSPGVKFPRVLGIEVVGTVESAPGGEFDPGETVATVMGGMGRSFDGGYAEYTSVPAAQVRPLVTDLPWQTLGALPELLQTAWGALFRALRLKTSDRLLIRGGTTSVGMAAAAIASANGAQVAATSRRRDREDLLKSVGATHFILDAGNVARDIRRVWHDGADKILELVGTSSLEDSLKAVNGSGIVCMAGMVGNEWSFAEFSPMDIIPTAVALTTYSGDVGDFMAMPLQYLVDQVSAGSLHIKIGHVFPLDQIVEAHRMMEENRARGKIVVVTS